MTTLVIGYGNTLCGDDGFGVIVAEAVRELALAGVTVITAHQLTPEMSVEISAAAQVIFVDARIDGGLPGNVVSHPVFPAKTTAALTHHVSPAGLLWMAAALYDHAPPATLITVSGAQFDLGTAMSAPVAAQIAPTTAQITRHNAP